MKTFTVFSSAIPVTLISFRAFLISFSSSVSYLFDFSMTVEPISDMTS